MCSPRSVQFFLAVAFWVFAASFATPASAESFFLRGDTTDDGSVDIADAIRSLDYLFLSGRLSCEASADINDDGSIDVADPISTLDFLFSGGPVPEAPFPNCGGDPTPDSLTCREPQCASFSYPVLDSFESRTALLTTTLSGVVPTGNDVRITGPAGMVILPSIGGVFSAIDLALEPNTLNTFFVEAVTPGGEISTPVAALVTQDSLDPIVTVTSPVAGDEVYVPTIDVAGSVADSLSGELPISVYVNGVPADVVSGVGATASFFGPGVPLDLGFNLIEVEATDVVGNTQILFLPVTRVEPLPSASILMEQSGSAQTGPVGEVLPSPIAVRVERSDGTPFVGKFVEFEVVNNDGKIGETSGLVESRTLLVSTDANGIAQVFWRLGGSAGSGLDRVRATSVDVTGSIVFCATGTAPIATQIATGPMGTFAAEVSNPLLDRLVVFASDSLNGVSGASVTFEVVSGGGLVDGQASFTTLTDATGHAAVEFFVGESVGSQVVTAYLTDKPSAEVMFTVIAVERTAGADTRWVGSVLDNVERPLVGVDCHLHVGGVEFTGVTGADGVFEIAGITECGPGELTIDGNPVRLAGSDPVTPGTFPELHYPVIVVPDATNSLPLRILLPERNVANQVAYDTTEGVELTIDGIAGVGISVPQGTQVTLADGTVVDPSNPVTLSLDLVESTDLPMPLPDGAYSPIAWTLQPGGAQFDPPLPIELPNLAGLAPGGLCYFLSFDHDTNRFQVVASGSVSEDGTKLESDPGMGLSISGWGGNCPPYPCDAIIEGDLGQPLVSGEMIEISVGNASTTVRPDGTYRLFGAPASPTGLQVRVRATRRLGGIQTYSATDCFTATCPGTVEALPLPAFSATPTSAPRNIELVADPADLDPNGVSFDFPNTVGLTVTGELVEGDPATDLLASPEQAPCVTFTVTPVEIATVENGVITPTGNLFGPFVVAVAIEGQARAAVRLSVIDPSGRTTDVVGSVELDGQPVPNASVTVTSLGAPFMGIADANGNFVIMGVPVDADERLSVTAVAPASFPTGRKTWRPTPSGVTDVGVVRLRTDLFVGQVSSGGGRDNYAISLDFDGDGYSDFASASYNQIGPLYLGSGVRFGGDDGLLPYEELSPDSEPVNLRWHHQDAADLDGLLTPFGRFSEELVVSTPGFIRAYFRASDGSTSVVDTALEPESVPQGFFAQYSAPIALARLDANETPDLVRTYVNGNQRWLEVRPGQVPGCSGALFVDGEEPGRFGGITAETRVPVGGTVTGPSRASLAVVIQGGRTLIYVGSADSGSTEPDALRVFEVDECGRPSAQPIAVHTLARVGEFAVGQFDAPGTPVDIVCFQTSGLPYIYLGTESGFSLTADSPLMTVPIGGPAGRIQCATADFDNDGVDEIVASEIGGYSHILRINNAGTTDVETFGRLGTEAPARPVLGDFNGDGLQDLATNHRGLAGNISVFFGDGAGIEAGEYYDPFPQDVGAGFYPQLIGDFNSDGRPDLIATLENPTATTDLLLGQQVGRPFALSGAPSVSVRTIAAADLDSDGDLDLVGSVPPGALFGDGVRIFDNIGGGDFCVGGGPCGPVQVLSSGRHVTGLETADFDGDGALDLVYIAASSGGVPPVLLHLSFGGGLGVIDFSLPLNYSTSLTDSLATLEVHDVDGDGDQDVVYSEGGVIYLRLFDPLLGEFGPESILPSPMAPFFENRILVFDAPDSHDFAIYIHQIGMVVHYDWNPTTLTASIASTYDTALGQDARAADVDNDGTVDLVVREMGLGILSVWRFSAIASDWESTVHPAGLATGLFVVDYDDDGDLDIITGTSTCPQACGASSQREALFVLKNRLIP